MSSVLYCFLFSSAKMGLVGLAKVLAIEGEASGIQCNVIVPMAISRLTQDLIPPGNNQIICISNDDQLCNKTYCRSDFVTQ